MPTCEKCGANLAGGTTVGVARVALPFVVASMALTIGANMLITSFVAKRHFAKLQRPVRRAG